MLYKGQAVSILQRKKLFGNEIVEIKILNTNQTLEVAALDLEEPQGQIATAEISLRALTAKIQSKLYSQTLLSPLESNLLPLPHQILALEKAINAPKIRFLIADEVGMGKTIETGLILKELKLRGIVKRTLILALKSAMLQWQQELKKHFNEDFNIIHSEMLGWAEKFNHKSGNVEFNIFKPYSQVILSHDAIKPIENRKGWSRKRIEEYNRARLINVMEAEYDLLIIDECHKVGGSSVTVGRYKMAEELCNSIPNVLLLSATPHRGKTDHFHRILQLLDKDAFTGEGPFSIAELQPYVVRTEKRKAIDYEGKPLFNKRTTAIVEVSYDSTRRQLQIQLYEKVTQYIIKGINRAERDKNKSYGFLMLLFQRMMSSSTQAILDALQKRYQKLQDKMGNYIEESEETWEELLFEEQADADYEQKIEDYLQTIDWQGYQAEQKEIQALLLDAQNCIAAEKDAKAETLLQLLNQQMQEENDYTLKFLIFTEFRLPKRCSAGF